jgi:hypothetical protein
VNLDITVTHPTNTVPPVQATELSHWRVLMKLHSDPIAAFADVGGQRDISETVAHATSIPDGGSYDFGVIWTDTDGQDSDMKVASFDDSIPVGKPPRPATGTVVVTKVA